jgi:hypothetical protein
MVLMLIISKIINKEFKKKLLNPLYFCSKNE